MGMRKPGKYLFATRKAPDDQTFCPSESVGLPLTPRLKGWTKKASSENSQFLKNTNNVVKNTYIVFGKLNLF